MEVTGRKQVSEAATIIQWELLIPLSSFVCRQGFPRVSDGGM